MNILTLILISVSFALFLLFCFVYIHFGDTVYVGSESDSFVSCPSLCRLGLLTLSLCCSLSFFRIQFVVVVEKALLLHSDPFSLLMPFKALLREGILGFLLDDGDDHHGSQEESVMTLRVSKTMLFIPRSWASRSVGRKLRGHVRCGHSC